MELYLKINSKSLNIISNIHIEEYKIKMEELENKYKYLINQLIIKEKLETIDSIFFIKGVLICKAKYSVFIIRDKFGENPLFYIKEKENIIFSNIILGVLKNTQYKHIINWNYFFNNLFTDCFVAQDNDTPFQNIVSLEPNTYIKITNEAIENVQLPLYKENHFSNNQEEIKKNFNMSLKNSAKNCELGFLLSGGFDSSLILCEMIKSNYVKNPNIFGISKNTTTQLDNADSEYIKKVLKKINTQFKYHEVSKKDNFQEWSIEIIDIIVKNLGSPLYDERNLLWYNLFYTAKKNGIKSLVGGEGADELWYGYYPMKWSWISQLFYKPLTKNNISNYFEETFNHFILKEYLTDYSKNNKEKTINKYVNKIDNIKDDDDKRKLMIFLVRYVLRGLLNYSSQIAKLIDIKVILPFLDYELSDIAFTLSPDQHLRPEYTGKDFLKKIYKNSLPEAVIRRKKSPLPKYQEINPYLKKIYIDNYKYIKSSKILKKMYKIDEMQNIVSENRSEFYGGINDTLLQIISIWRFEVLYGKYFQ